MGADAAALPANPPPRRRPPKCDGSDGEAIACDRYAVTGTPPRENAPGAARTATPWGARAPRATAVVGRAKARACITPRLSDATCETASAGRCSIAGDG